MKTLQTNFKEELERLNYSARTVHTYGCCISAIEKHFNQSIETISIDQIKEFLHFQIHHKKTSVAYINQIISALKIFHESILKKRWQSIEIKRPRREKKLPNVLSRQEVKNILESIRNIKHKAMLMTLYSAGLRRSELMNLQPADIDSARMLIKVCGGKGKKDRYTILSPQTLDILRVYYKLYKPKKWLFEGFKQHQYSSTSLMNVIHLACKKCNIHKKVSAHTLRHSFATHLLEQGVNIQLIQQLLGHSSPRTTCVYLHIQQYQIDKVKSPIDYIEGGVL